MDKVLESFTLVLQMLLYFSLKVFTLLQENLQTLGSEIERLIKQQRDPEDGARRK